jgi:hypothetical protein
MRARATTGRPKRSVRQIVAVPALAALLIALLLPGTALAVGTIGALSIAPSQVTGGASVQGTVSLAFADPAPTLVRLWSADPSVASVPTSITVPAGATAATFTITTNPAAPPTITTITAATPDNGLRTANLSVNPATPAGPSLSSVSFTPATVVGGSSATGTARFGGTMANGAVVQLTSSNPAVAQVPAETVVSAGTATATFNVSTATVAVTTTVTVTAKWFGITRTATVTVAPGAPPAADTVRITKAEWKAGRLRIEATGSNPTAILSVYSQAGNFMFTLTNNGGGKFSDQRGFISNPLQITVRSNFGGSATASTR